MVNDFSDEEFSFKGIAPGDRKPAAIDASTPEWTEGPSEAAPQRADPSATSDSPLPPLPAAGADGEDASGLLSLGDASPQAGEPATAPGGRPKAVRAEGCRGGGPDGDQGGHASGGAPPTRGRLRVEIEESTASSPSSVSPRHQVEDWLKQMVAANASDLILRSGGRPSQRLNGRIQFLEGQVPGPGPMLEVLKGILGERRMEAFVEVGAADAALDLDGLGRFRINAYKQMGEPAIVIRRINEDAPSLDDLHLPAEELKGLALRKRGLVLVTGVAGSGKSTTLSAMIEFMNRNVERHIVTLEDPIELLFRERYCVISQREIGTDTGSFKLGLKHALRQSPDVIFIGEMRDAETVLAALEAIETGHLVMSTMHTVNAAQTVDRILGYFPVERHAQIRQRIADTLAGVLSMRLVPRAGGGLIPAYELMSSTPQVRELLEGGRTTELGRVIESGLEPGLVPLNSRLAELVQSGAVSLEDACEASDRPDELVMALRGIHGGVRAVARAESLRAEGDVRGLSPEAPEAADPAPETELRLRKGPR